MFGEQVEHALTKHHCDNDPDRGLEDGILAPLRKMNSSEFKNKEQYIIFVHGLDECLPGVSHTDATNAKDRNTNNNKNRRGRRQFGSSCEHLRGT